MADIVFITTMGVVFTFIYTLAFKTLPGEKWQVFASIPSHKTGDGTWHGINITFYGLLTATGYTIALSILIIMMISAGTTVRSLIICIGSLLVIFIPSAKIMAFIVEKKKHTMTVGGAVFAMIIAAPWIIAGVNEISGVIDAGYTGEGVFLASLITAYSFGEGFGRLACISFGCCYGRPVSELPGFFQKLFSRYNFVFTGKTKKISYCSQMDGVITVPVQAITAVLYTASGLAGFYLFLKGHYYASFFLSLSVTQLWRFASEFLRADYRGGGFVSVYQVMSLFTLPYYIIYIFITGMSYSPPPELVAGIKFMWNPAVLILLFVMWTGCLIYTGVSSVTASTISIFIVENRI